MSDFDFMVSNSSISLIQNPMGCHFQNYLRENHLFHLYFSFSQVDLDSKYNQKHQKVVNSSAHKSLFIFFLN